MNRRPQKNVSVSTRPSFWAGAARRLVEHQSLTATSIQQYDVSADGQRFIVPELIEGAEPVVRVVLNWHEEFRDPSRTKFHKTTDVALVRG